MDFELLLSQIKPKGWLAYEYNPLHNYRTNKYYNQKTGETITEDDFNNPLFTVPDGITKARMHVWIEGQDIDSLETDSNGAEFSFSIDFVKDTQGYEQEW